MSFIFVPGEVHIMVDIETLSTRKDAAITEIGAVVVEMFAHPELTNSFWEECWDPYGHTDPDTIAWRISNNLPWHPYPAVPYVGDVLSRFFSWVELVSKTIYHGATPILWCKGTDFDKVILVECARRCDLEKRIPWQYNHFYDLRTQLKAHPQFKVPKSAVLHNGLKDAIQQAEQLVKIDSHLDAMTAYWDSRVEAKNAQTPKVQP